jgi:hypothetical protein
MRPPVTPIAAVAEATPFRKDFVSDSSKSV